MSTSTANYAKLSIEKARPSTWKDFTSDIIDPLAVFSLIRGQVGVARLHFNRKQSTVWHVSVK